MKKRHYAHHLWLIVAAYGVWFAVLSGLEEIAQGDMRKAVMSFLLGTATYIYIEYYTNKK